MNNQLDALPFANNALEPIISADALALHYGSHHRGYLKKLEGLIAGTEFERRPLEEIIAESRFSPNRESIFDNAAQIWNHTFFWNSISPAKSHPAPSGCFLHQLERDFGSLDGLKGHMTSTGMKRFGSGWLWLVSVNGRLDVYTTANADTPAANPDVVPLLTIDLWEHAYYLDWHNRRGEYLEAIVNHLLDWDAASRRYEANRPLVIRKTFFSAA